MTTAENALPFEFDQTLEFELVLAAASSRLQDAQTAQANSPEKLYFDVAKDYELDEYFANYVVGAQSKRPWNDEIIEIGLQVVSDDVDNPQLVTAGPKAHFKVAWPNSPLDDEKKLHVVDKALYVAEVATPDRLPKLGALLGQLMSYRLIAIS